MGAARLKINNRTRGDDCNCELTGRPPAVLSQPLLHMDECDDPDCIDFEQLKELQKSIDRFTDYDNYEKCCDGHHADGEECCGTGILCCQAVTEPEDCEECFDDCDECLEEHQQSHFNAFDEILDHGTPVKCDDDCMQCEEECEENGHDKKDCPQDHHTSWDSCISTCGICVDPTPLPLPDLDAEVQLYDLNSYVPHITPCDETCTPPQVDDYADFNVQQPMQSAFDVALDHWQTFQQAHHCAPDPCLIDQAPKFPPPQHVDPGFGFTFGCDPTAPGNQYPWQQHDVLHQPCTVQAFNLLNLNSLDQQPMQHFHTTDLLEHSISTPVTQPSTDSDVISNGNQSAIKPVPSAIKTGKSCQWLMPCGSICGQTFARTDDLKKHVKNSHLSLKGTVTCRWGSACTASFATEAALTGHISKKHLAPLYAAGSATASKADSKSPQADSNGGQAEELPWKCTFPGCNKSFMYKQVRDDHLASHTGSNRAHCPICHQWLNAEGSNFRRHMASHRPENEHMKCKHQHLGCRRKFPRLDNLRRHEACCKYGKKAAANSNADEDGGHNHAHGHGHAHHHHHHTHHHTGHHE